jgi:bifunctional DNase/RNase
MKCATDACDANGDIHFTLVEQQSRVNYRVLCREHAKRFLHALHAEQSSSRNEDAGPMQAVVEMIVYDETLGLAYIYLRDTHGTKRMRIQTGPHEWGFVDMLLRAGAIGRPLTHHAFANAISSLGGVITQAIIDDFDETTQVYFAKLVVSVRDTEAKILVDLRPSDAVALAIVSNVPIMISEVVLAKGKKGGWWN